MTTSRDLSRKIGHPNRMLQVARLVRIDKETGRSAFTFLERLFDTFQAVAAMEKYKGGTLGWNDGETQRFRINNRRLAEEHGVSIRHINRLLARLQLERLIAVHHIDTWQREIDLAPLAKRAVEWQLRLERQKQETAQARDIRKRAGAVIAAYVAILNAFRAEEMKPVLGQVDAVDRIGLLEKFHGRYAACKSSQHYIALEASIPEAEAANEYLIEAIAMLRSAHMISAGGKCMAAIKPVHKVVPPVDNNPGPVGKIGDFSAGPMTEMSSPHDRRVTHNTTTTSHKGVKGRRENGDPAFTASATRAGSGYERVLTTGRNGAEFSSCSPENWPKAWGLVLKLQPAWKRAFSSCSKPADFARWIAEHHIPVAANLIDDALAWHNPIDVVGALAVAASRDINEIAVAQRYREAKARGIYAAGMLRKQRMAPEIPATGAGSRSDGLTDRADRDELRPWPSVYGLLDRRIDGHA